MPLEYFAICDNGHIIIETWLICGWGISVKGSTLSMAITFMLVNTTFRIMYISAAFVTLEKPQHDKANKITCAHSEASDQSGHPPSLIRAFALPSVGS